MKHFLLFLVLWWFFFTFLRPVWKNTDIIISEQILTESPVGICAWSHNVPYFWTVEFSKVTKRKNYSRVANSFKHTRKAIVICDWKVLSAPLSSFLFPFCRKSPLLIFSSSSYFLSWLCALQAVKIKVEFALTKRWWLRKGNMLEFSNSYVRIG